MTTDATSTGNRGTAKGSSSNSDSNEEFLRIFSRYEELPCFGDKVDSLLDIRKNKLNSEDEANWEAYICWSKLHEQMCTSKIELNRLTNRRKSIWARLNALEKSEKQHFIQCHNVDLSSWFTSNIPKRGKYPVCRIDTASHAMYRRTVYDKFGWCHGKERTELQEIVCKEEKALNKVRVRLSIMENFFEEEEIASQECRRNCHKPIKFLDTTSLPELSDGQLGALSMYMNPNLARSVCFSWNQRIEKNLASVMPAKTSILKFRKHEKCNPGVSFYRWDLAHFQDKRRYLFSLCLKGVMERILPIRHLWDFFPAQDCRQSFIRSIDAYKELREPWTEFGSRDKKCFLLQESVASLMYVLPTQVIFEELESRMLEEFRERLPTWWWSGIKEVELRSGIYDKNSNIWNIYTDLMNKMESIESLKIGKFSQTLDLIPLVATMKSATAFTSLTRSKDNGEILMMLAGKSNLSSTGLRSLLLKGNAIRTFHLNYFLEHMKLAEGARIQLTIFDTRDNWRRFLADRAEFSEGHTLLKNRDDEDDMNKEYSATNINNTSCFFDIYYIPKQREL